MNQPGDAAAAERTRRILEDLEAVRENLLALSDDIWLAIDHNDPQALEEGVQFKRSYNAQLTEFDKLAAALSALVQQFTNVRLAADEQLGEGDCDRNERLVRELNREEPHAIDEHLTFKRPHGFILDGQAAVGVNTWRRLFELICRQLLLRNPERFRALPENRQFISNRDHPGFSRNPDVLRSAVLIGDGIHAEINLSANALRDTLRRLLAAFEIPENRLRLFLREDRNAPPELE